jgi:oligopeptide/dipeptide ABC transporter ATP-binding protein
LRTPRSTVATPETETRPPPLEGEIPSPTDPPAGCRFHTRSPYGIDKCRAVEPPLREIAVGHTVVCHLVEPAAA